MHAGRRACCLPAAAAAARAQPTKSAVAADLQRIAHRHQRNLDPLADRQPDRLDDADRTDQLTFGGPFQSLGAGKLPSLEFSVSMSGQGKTGGIGILSTGTAGYVSASGRRATQLPAATFQRLESSFAGLASSPGGGSGASTLSKLGIHPLHWLVNPSVVGAESIGGTGTTHIRAAVDVAALSRRPQHVPAEGILAGGIGRGRRSPRASRRRRAARSPLRSTIPPLTSGRERRQDIRRLAIALSLPVTGQISTALGGLREAGIGLTMQYADLNRPQTITAPATVRPFSEFTVKLRTFLASVQSSLGGGAAGTPGASGATGTPTATTGTPHHGHADGDHGHPDGDHGRTRDRRDPPALQRVHHPGARRRGQDAALLHTDQREVGTTHSGGRRGPTPVRRPPLPRGGRRGLLRRSRLSPRARSGPGSARAAHRGGARRPAPHRR